MATDTTLTKGQMAHNKQSTGGSVMDRNKYGYTKLLNKVSNTTTFSKLHDPIKLNQTIAACRALSNYAVPSEDQTRITDWIKTRIQRTEDIWPRWIGWQSLRNAQEEVQEAFKMAIWWNGEDNRRNLGQHSLDPKQDAGSIVSETTIAADLPPWTPKFNFIMSFTTFRNLHENDIYYKAFAACQAIARMSVPDSTANEVKRWLEHLLDQSEKLHGIDSKLFQRQMLLQQTLWLALWKCQCDPTIVVKKCKYTAARNRLASGTWTFDVPPPEVKRFVEEEDLIIERLSIQLYLREVEKKWQEKMKQLEIERQLAGIIEAQEEKEAENDTDVLTAIVSDVGKIQKPTLFHLEPAASRGRISKSLRAFCKRWNRELLRHPWLGAKVQVEFRGKTTGDKGRVLKVYSSGPTWMWQVKKCIKRLLSQKSEGVEGDDEDDEEVKQDRDGDCNGASEAEDGMGMPAKTEGGEGPELASEQEDGEVEVGEDEALDPEGEEQMQSGIAQIEHDDTLMSDGDARGPDVEFEGPGAGVYEDHVMGEGVLDEEYSTQDDPNALWMERDEGIIVE